MTIGNRSQLRISRLGHYLGVGPNWDASILLKGKSSTAEDVFTIEFCNETEELRCGDEFTLRAYNGYYVAVSDRVLCACARATTEATRFSVHDDSGRDSLPSYGRDLILFAAQKPVAVPLLEGGQLTIAETSEDRTTIVLQQCGLEGTAVEQSEDGAAPASFRQLSGLEHVDDDEWLDEEDASLGTEKLHVEKMSENSISTVEDQPLASPRDKPGVEPQHVGAELSLEPQNELPRRDQQGVRDCKSKQASREAAASIPVAIEESPPSVDAPALESVRDRLEEQLQRLLEARKIECQLADECNQLMERCAQLQENIPRIVHLTEQREHLRKNLDEITRQFPDEAILAFDAELEILSRMRQWLSAVSSQRDSLSATLQQTIIANQHVLDEVAALQIELASKKEALSKQREQADLLHEELKPHLDANLRIATVVPGAENCVDLLRQAQRLLDESDRLLAALIRSQEQEHAALR